MEKIRTFIAIPLPQEILKEIERLTKELRPITKGVKWVKPESVHLTLKFLGNLTEEELHKVFSAMDALFQSPVEKFQLTVKGLGAFPNLKRPKVLWVGISGSGLDQLKEVQHKIESDLEKQGFPKENRKFSPHLTVGRIKFFKKLDELMESFVQYPFPEKEFTVEQINIMRSDLKPTGAVYTVQKSYTLKKPE